MVTTKAVKSTALITLKGNWALLCAQAMVPVFATIIIVLSCVLFSLPFGQIASCVIFALSFVFILSPIWLGVIRTYWRKANGVTDGVSGCFYYFSKKANYKRSLKYSFKVLLHWLRVALVLLLPVILIHVATDSEIYELFGISIPLFLMNLRYLDVVFHAVALVLATVHLINLYLPAFIFVSCEDMNPSECFFRGVEIGRYTKSRFFAHFLGFFGWILLSFLLIPLLFTLPYLLMSYVVECRYNVAFYNLSGQQQRKTPIYNV
ncbi:MAG: hypothetical protein E7565_09300 [Ruminococcaceae bacterium]|nr:hypothetical protein [Oscillospiraceae bacterium]